MTEDEEREARGKARPQPLARTGGGLSLGALVVSAAQLLAPNSLQFNEHEFQHSPKEAQAAAREAVKLVKPGLLEHLESLGLGSRTDLMLLLSGLSGDLIFITTSGFLYSIGRRVTHSDYDHVAVVLDESVVLHVGMPTAKLMPLERLLLPQRQPVVLRAPMTDDEREVFLRCARQLVGTRYDIVRAFQLVLRLALKHTTGSSPLRKLPLSMNPDSWICSDAIMVLLAGCSEKFREVLAKARKETELDIFSIGSASLSDFSRIRQAQPEALRRVPLPVMDYTLTPPPRSWRQYVPELVHFVRKVQAGKVKWPMLEESVFPEARALASRVPPTSWPIRRKIQVLGYAMVLLLVLKRGLAVRKVLRRALQFLLARYLVQQVLLHLSSKQRWASKL